jgi:very-short-patch-repair endonuclease
MGYAKYLQYKKRLKRDATPAEKRIKKLLNQLRITHNFQKIFVNASAIVDFFLPDTNVIIELDGKHHLQQIGRDDARTDRIMRGYPLVSLIRIPNDVAMRLTKTPLRAIIYSVARKNVIPFKFKIHPAIIDYMEKTLY